jgi:hypothetical protein
MAFGVCFPLDFLHGIPTPEVGVCLTADSHDGGAACVRGHHTDDRVRETGSGADVKNAHLARRSEPPFRHERGQGFVPNENGRYLALAIK